MNYIKCGDKHFTKYTYVYIDTPEHLADDIFINHRLRVWFKGDYSSEKNSYLIVHCEVKKRNAQEFEDCLRELENKAVLLGYRDYKLVAAEIVQSVR